MFDRFVETVQIFKRAERGVRHKVSERERERETLRERERQRERAAETETKLSQEKITTMKKPWSKSNYRCRQTRKLVQRKD